MAAADEGEVLEVTTLLKCIQSIQVHQVAAQDLVEDQSLVVDNNALQ